MQTDVQKIKFISSQHVYKLILILLISRAIVFATVMHIKLLILLRKRLEINARHLCNIRISNPLLDTLFFFDITHS